MIFYLAYAFISLATAIAVSGSGAFHRSPGLIGYALIGASWPLLFTVRIIHKIID
jgi:hypothetical protein